MLLQYVYACMRSMHDVERSPCYRYPVAWSLAFQYCNTGTRVPVHRVLQYTRVRTRVPVYVHVYYTCTGSGRLVTGITTLARPWSTILERVELRAIAYQFGMGTLVQSGPYELN